MRLLKREVVQSSIEDIGAEELEITEREEIRKTGIDIVGDAPWGAHFCQFYETREDLIDVLVPYFKVGLENNEFCMWVTSEPLSEEEAKEAMRRAVPDFDRYLESGQIEIVPHTEWYLKDGAFNLQRVLNAWIDKLNQALAAGYDGIRVTGNTAWLEKNDWRSFVDYEGEVNNAIGRYRMLAVCTYSLDKCGASEVIDVVCNHQFALIKRRGEWELIESSERKRAEEALRESEEKFRNIFESANDSMALLDRSGRILDVNTKTVEVFGGSEEELLGKHFTRIGVFSPKDIPRAMSAFTKLLAGRKTTVGVRIKNKKGREIDVEVTASLMKINSKFAGILVIARDVTERKKAEEALRDSEEKYRNLVEKEKDIIYTLDDKGNITFASPAVETILDYRPEEVVGKHFMVLIPKEWQEKTGADFNNLLRTGEITSETVLLGKKGQPHFVEYSSTVIKDGKKVVGTRGIVRDITERKKTEEEMMKTKAFLESSLSSAPDGVFLIDKQGKFTYANPIFLKWIGYEAKDVIGKTIQEIVPKITAPENAKIIEERAKRRLKTGEPITGVEVEIIDKDGKSMPVSYSAAGIRDDEGNVIGEVVFVRDITERKKMEEKLRQYSDHLEELVQRRTEELLESEKRYSVLVEEARDGVAILQDAKIVFANKRGAEIFGYSRDELIGLPFEKLVDEKYLPLVKERYMRRMRGEEVPPTYEIAFVAKSGERIPVEVSATLIHYQGRPADLVIVRDIRERKRMEEERLRLEKLATIGELATMVGHDLRNPLQSIENATYYLNNELPRLPISQKALEMLQVLNESVNYADKVIRDLHDFSATKTPILKKTNINAIVKETLSQVGAPENVKLITELGHLPEIKADKDMTKRCFVNLALNGIQAMEKGGTLKVSTKKTKDFVEIRFKDTGVGIPRGNMEKIFTPFFSTRAKGMGMGLPICKKFVDAHGGSIDVESKEGKGSTFTVKLPIR